MIPPTPLIIGTNGLVAAIDRSTGAELWRTALQEGVFGATKRTDIAVLVADGAVYAGGAGHLYCLSLANGQILWHNELPGMGYNDISIALEGVSVQYLQKTVHHHSSS